MLWFAKTLIWRDFSPYRSARRKLSTNGLGGDQWRSPRSRLRDNFRSQLPVWVAVQPPI